MSKQITPGMYADPDSRILIYNSQHQRMAVVTISSPWNGVQQPAEFKPKGNTTFTAQQLRRIADFMDGLQDPAVPPFCQACGAPLHREADGSLTCLRVPACTPGA